jgi:hypothetical protein
LFFARVSPQNGASSFNLFRECKVEFKKANLINALSFLGFTRITTLPAKLIEVSGGKIYKLTHIRESFMSSNLAAQKGENKHEQFLSPAPLLLFSPAV